MRGCIISFDAWKWAIAQELKPSSSKFVLLALADAVQDASGRAFLSSETIGRFTSLDAKTITSAIADLLARGWIADTGERVGRTGRVKVYELCSYVRSLVPCICSDSKAVVLEGKTGAIESHLNRGHSGATAPKAGGLERHLKRVHSDAPPSLQLPGIPAAVSSGSSTGEHAQAVEVLAYLNRVSSSRFQPTAKNLGFILARMAEGYPAHVLKLLAYHRLTVWRRDPKMLEYLRPATLYNAEKCNQYAGQVPGPYFKTCAECSIEILPDVGACPNGCTARAAAAVEAARAPMPEHIRRREGESVKQWIGRLKEAGKVAA